MDITFTSSGETALVTGAASGIGHAIMQKLAAAGVAVIAADRDTIPQTPTGVVARQLDITSPHERDRLVNELPSLNYVVNAAGIARIEQPFDLTAESWAEVFDVNVQALFFLTRGVAQAMPQGSAIVNIASIAGRTGASVELASYNSSKAAVMTLTKTLAHTLAPSQVRVNCVCPGNVTTPMHEAVKDGLARIRQSSNQAVEESYNAQIPLRRPAAPSEVADVVCFLLSNGSSYITGQAINVCGGLLMS